MSIYLTNIVSDGVCTCCTLPHFRHLRLHLELKYQPLQYNLFVPHVLGKNNQPAHSEPSIKYGTCSNKIKSLHGIKQAPLNDTWGSLIKPPEDSSKGSFKDSSVSRSQATMAAFDLHGVITRWRLIHRHLNMILLLNSTNPKLISMLLAFIP